MLQSLSIKNFALIENSRLNLSSGLNIITGETGSGKSIIIQALAILLGGRASVEHIRTGYEEAILDGVIDLSTQQDLSKSLNEKGIDIEDDLLIVRRVLMRSGKSRSFLNGQQVTSKEIAAIAENLFDFHGQHDGVSLLKKQTHIEYLDSYIKIKNELSKIKELYNSIKQKEDELKILDESQKDKERRLELLKHEINEITAANIKKGEDEELNEQIKVCENIETLALNLKEIFSIFQGETGVLTAIRKSKSLLEKSASMDKNLSKLSNDLSDVYYRLEDIENDIIKSKDSYNFTPGELDQLQERSETIEKIKRKYGGTIEEVYSYLKKAESELEIIEFSDTKKSEISSEIKKIKESYIELAQTISKKRREGALIIEKEVEKELQKLAMNNAQFKIEISSEESSNSEGLFINNKCVKYQSNGIDKVEFLISPNKGEPPKSLIKIASGGELSRIILSLKKVLASDDSIATMIFDEIDSGIGGMTALSVATALKELSDQKQLVCITHLPQIAAGGTYNFTISKSVEDGRTSSKINKIDDELKIKEIARMLSGQITDTSLQHARELIQTV